MKKYKIIATVCIASVFCSCQTSNVSNKQDNLNSISEPVIEIKNLKEIEYAESLTNIFIKSISSPKEIIKGRKFKEPFKFSVSKIQNIESQTESTDENSTTTTETPIANFKVNVKYPSSKDKSELQFSTIELTSDENGIISFNPENTNFTCASSIQVYPAIPQDVNASDEVVINAIQQKKITKDIKIKSDIINKGAVLFVWEYNEKGRPTGNSYNILSELRKRGITLTGNAPVSDVSYIEKPLSELYQANFEIIGSTMYGYLLSGTLKFEQPVTKVEDGYTCTLVFQLDGIDMKTGDVIFSTTQSHSAQGSNWNNCVSKCKNELTVKIVDELIYGL